MKSRTTLRFIPIGSLCLSAVLLAGAGCRTGTGGAAEPRLLELTGELSVHDPVIMKEKGRYYIFCTGGGWRRGGVIPIHCSTNLLHWDRCGFVFDHLPAWATNEIPEARGAWAPDISFFNGRYHLYYALSSFGVNESAIGLAVNKTLDPRSAKYKWVDQGMVVRSRQGQDDFNAIDPQLAIEDKNNIWLCWGSFWSGIKMRRVDPATGKLSTADTKLYSLASRPHGESQQTPPVEGAIEAPTIVKHDQWWYLFASFDLCCKGTNSTYNVRVGRSEKITGPYLDRDGKPMLEGGGTVVIEATDSYWRGPGHQTVLSDGSQDYLIFHAYDGRTGRPELKISTMVWENSWPRVARLP